MPGDKLLDKRIPAGPVGLGMSDKQVGGKHVFLPVSELGEIQGSSLRYVSCSKPVRLREVKATA